MPKAFKNFFFKNSVSDLINAHVLIQGHIIAIFEAHMTLNAHVFTGLVLCLHYLQQLKILQNHSFFIYETSLSFYDIKQLKL